MMSAVQQAEVPPSAFLDATIPNTKLARAVTEFVRDTETDLPFNHSSRVYLFGALASQERGLKFDPEADIGTVWAATALHATPGIPQHVHPVVALVTAGVEMDVFGLTYGGYADDLREAAVTAYPRTAVQGSHRPGLPRGHPAQARDHVRQRRGRRTRRQGPAFPPRQLLRGHPQIPLEGLIPSDCTLEISL